MHTFMRKPFKDDFFQDFFKDLDFDSRPMLHSRPLTNIKKLDNKHQLEIMAAGFEKSDFTIELAQGKLIVSAKKETKDEDYTKQEFQVREFKREFYLGEGFAESDINASYEAGILTIDIPIKKKKSKMIKIE